MITDSFDNKTEPILSLRDFYGEPGSGHEICLVIFSKVVFEHILASFACEKTAHIASCGGGTDIYSLHYDGMDIAFYLSQTGSVMAAQWVIEANYLTGARKFIMFGSAGSLDEEKTTGKFVIPTEAYRDEGMSYHYAPPSDYITIRNHERLAGLFDELSLPHVEGRIWTTDAFCRETVGQIAKRRAEGCIAVEMEVAGVQAVCDFHSFELYDFLVTGDVLSTTEYRVEGLHAANHSLDKLYIALEIAKRI